MKKFAFVIPVLIFLGFMFVTNNLVASGNFNPMVMVGIFGGAMILMALIRPKNKQKAKPVTEIEAKVRGDFARTAFADNQQLNAKFQAALKDYSGNMPKAALSKLQKLAPLCTNDQDKYAVAVATAQIQLSLGKAVEAVRQYTTALVIHPTAELALEQGSCYQRLGELSKARSAYTYALDLDESNLEAHSAIATTYVADREYEEALGVALKVLEKNDKHASALATTAICYGLLNDPILSKRYTDLAEEQGYSRKKITDTINALKK